MSCQTIAVYEQSYRLDGVIPSPYLDPAVLLSNNRFCIKPGEEKLLIVSGSGFRSLDNMIYPMHLSDVTGQYIVNSHTNQSLCYLIKNTSPDFSIYVGRRSKLLWLLQFPTIVSKLCYGSHQELSMLKMRALTEMDEENSCNDDKCKNIANETLYIH